MPALVDFPRPTPTPGRCPGLVQGGPPAIVSPATASAQTPAQGAGETGPSGKLVDYASGPARFAGEPGGSADWTRPSRADHNSDRNLGSWAAGLRALNPSRFSASPADGAAYGELRSGGTTLWASKHVDPRDGNWQALPPWRSLGGEAAQGM